MGETAAEFLNLLVPLFVRFCHRDPARSYLLADGTVLACARCAGLYAGAFAGAAASVVWRIAGVGLASRAATVTLAVAIALTPLEVAGEAARLWDGTRAVRLVLGLLTGTALACAIIRSMGGGAARPSGPGRRWLLTIPLFVDAAILPMILRPSRWETTGAMIGGTILVLGLLTLVLLPVAWLVDRLRRHFFKPTISEGSCL